MRHATLRLGLAAALVALSSCRTTDTRPGLSGLRADGDALRAAKPVPVFVVIGGYGTCKAMAFDAAYKSPFDGRVWASSPYYRELFAGTGTVEHGNSMVSSFLGNTFFRDTYKEFWRGDGDWEATTIFACHSADTAFDKQEFVWWNPTAARDTATIAAKTDPNERYAAMGFDWFYLKTPPADDAGDPYARDGYRGGFQGFDRFTAAVKKLAADLNPNGVVRPVYLLGHSMGGYAATRLAASLEKDVDLLGLLSVDPISPGRCPAVKLDWWTNVYDVALTGVALTSVRKLPGCMSGFPPDLLPFAAKARQILAANNERLGWAADKKSYFHYYQDQFAVLRSGPNPYAQVNVLKRYETVKVKSGLRLLFFGPIISYFDGDLQAGRALNAHVAVNLDDEVWKWAPGSGRTDSWIGYRHRADALSFNHEPGAQLKWSESGLRQPLEASLGGVGLVLAGEAEGDGTAIFDYFENFQTTAVSSSALEGVLQKDQGVRYHCSPRATKDLVAVGADETMLGKQTILCYDGTDDADPGARSAILVARDGAMLEVSRDPVPEGNVRVEASAAERAGSSFAGKAGSVVALPPDGGK